MGDGETVDPNDSLRFSTGNDGTLAPAELFNDKGQQVRIIFPLVQSRTAKPSEKINIMGPKNRSVDNPPSKRSSNEQRSTLR